MAYNLPPSWDSGFVLPENVIDEGLQRRAFVSKWMPRGTYDDETDGTAGYDVPQYVLDEGIGQGAFTTEWQPRGTYNGPRIPHWLNQRPKVVKTQALPGGGQVVTVQPLGDAPLPDPFETYGQKAAQGLIARVSGLPQGQRQKVLKGILDQVDKSLWTRTQDIFNRYLKQGMTPQDAFPLALARAMSTGIVAEIVHTGARRTAPRVNSLLGLGCYGYQPNYGALGGFGDATATDDCRSTPGYSWVYAAGGLPGHWERTKAGGTDVPFCTNGPPKDAVFVKPPCTSDTDTGPNGQGCIQVRTPEPAPDFFVGPFGFTLAELQDREWVNTKAPSATIANRAAGPDIMYLSPDDLADFPVQPKGSPVRRITPEVLKWLEDRLRSVKDAAGRTDVPITYVDASDSRKAASFVSMAAGAKPWFDAMGITETTPVRLHDLWYLKTTMAPFARTKNPKTGADMLLNVSLAPINYYKEWNPDTNRLALKVWLTRVADRASWGALWDPMIFIDPRVGLRVTTVLGAEALNYLKDLSCDILNDPNGKVAAQAGASAVAAYYGIPPEAGADGVNMAATQCGKPPPPPPPIVSHSIWPKILLAGGAVGAVYFVTRKPKKKRP